MLNWFDALMPKERGFFDLFDRHALSIAAGASALKTMLNGAEDIAACCRQIEEQEKAADEVVRAVNLHVRRTFITPFDRSDIYGLTKALDDSIDQMEKTARNITVYDVRAFEPEMRQFGEVIEQAAGLTVEAVHLLRASRRNVDRLSEIADEIGRLEGQADDVHVAGLKSLYAKHGGRDPMAYIVGEDLYDHLEKVMDRFEDVSDRISGIVVDHL